jgi:hypothetical protein
MHPDWRAVREFAFLTVLIAAIVYGHYWLAIVCFLGLILSHAERIAR